MKKVLLGFFLSSMFFGLQAVHPDFKIEKNRIELIKLYKQYLNTLPKNLDVIAFLKSFSDQALKKITSYLDIDLSLNEIKENYKKTGFIQLRKVDQKLRTLVIGCGNRSFSQASLDDVVLDKEYRMAHVHKGAITVDPDPKKNPTIIAYFGEKPLKALKAHSFEKLLIEVVGIPSLLNLKYFISDVNRLLVKSGRLYYDYGGYGPVKVDINKFKEWGKRWDDRMYCQDVVDKNLLLLPSLFYNMMKTRGAKKVKTWFEKLLREGNWVHKDKIWQETFSIINEKVNSYLSFTTLIKGLLGLAPPSFTIKESRLIRLAAMELNVL